jgi:hypothetical protein
MLVLSPRSTLRSPSVGIVLSTVVMGFFFVTAGAVDLPLTRLDSVFPAGSKPGGEVEVTLAGADLDGADTVWASHPGITGKLVKDKVFAVKVESGVPEGVYDLRIPGNNGVSNPKGFVVDRHDVLRKSGECTVAKPMDLPVGSAVFGAVAAASRDHYRVELKKGKRMTIRCLAKEIDSKLNPVFSVLDESGRKLVSNGRRAALSFEAPSDGKFLISVHDLTFGGGADFSYRLSVDESPILEAVVPVAVPQGGKSKVTLFGRGLLGSKPSAMKGWDGKALEQVEAEVEVPTGGILADGVSAPAGVSAPVFYHRVRGASGVSNPVPLVPVEGSVVALSGDPLAEPPEVKIPGAVSGLFAKGFGGNAFGVDLKKGEAVVAEVFAHRLGLAEPNPYLRVEKAGNHLAEGYGPDLNAGGPKLSTLHNDPTLRFEAKEDGRYVFRVTDLSGAARPGMGSPFVVVLRRERPDFALVAVTEPPPENPNDRAVSPKGVSVRPGGVTPLRVVAMPAGVTAEATTIPAGKNDGYLLLRATADAAKGMALVKITGKTAAGLERVARGATVSWPVADTNNDTPSARLARGEGVPVGVSSLAAPLKLAVEAVGPLEAAVGAKLEVPLKIDRAPEFKDVLKVKAGGFVGAETFKEVDADAKTATLKVVLDLAALKVGAGKHVAFFTAQGKGKVAGKDVVTTAYSPAVSFEVKAPVKPADAKPAAK